MHAMFSRPSACGGSGLPRPHSVDGQLSSGRLYALSGPRQSRPGPWSVWLQWWSVSSLLSRGPHRWEGNQVRLGNVEKFEPRGINEGGQRMVGGVMTWTGEGDARAGGVMEGSGNLMCWGL